MTSNLVSIWFPGLKMSLKSIYGITIECCVSIENLKLLASFNVGWSPKAYVFQKINKLINKKVKGHNSS